MKKIVCLLAVITLLAGTAAEAQYGGYGYRRYGPRPHRDREEDAYFEPTVHVNLGYGFPNMDRYELPGFDNTDMGRPSQTGPFMGSIDYQFNRRLGIGLMVTHGTVTAPYYDYSNNTNTPDFTGHVTNTAVMLDLVRYFQAGSAVTPYLRTAIGVNIWQQDYLDASGSTAAEAPDLNPLAYQVSLGAQFHLSKQAGLFLEAGFGKYILAGGLALSFK